MASLLNFLIPGMMSQGTSQVGVPEVVDENVIEVLGSNPMAPAPRNVNTPVSPLSDYPLRTAPVDKEVAEIVPRRGMFNTKGTLRDVLGVVGDAFLMQAGRNPIYREQRNREKQGDALYGFAQDPMAAVERLAAAGYADEAMALRNMAGQDQAKSQAAAAAANKEGDARYQQYSRLFSQYAGAATPETFDRIAPLLNQLKQRGGLGDEYIVPDTFDENLLTSYQYGGMPANQQMSTVHNERVQTERERHNRASEQTSRISATRPRAQPRAPQPTAMSQAAPILEKVRRGQTLTKGEQEVLNRTAPIRGASSRRALPPLPPGFKLP